MFFDFHEVTSMKKLYLVSAVLVLVLSAQGCASSRSGAVYSRDQARQAQEVKMGVVEDVREVLIEGTEGAVGGVAGTLAGAIGGSAIGGGRGSAIAAIAGAVIGGLAGAAAEEGITRKPGWEITVRLDNGNSLAVVQEAVENEVFRIGSRVRLMTDFNGISRVSNLSYAQPGAMPPAVTYPAPGR